ncbi:MAG: IS1595 family transposase [Bacteroidetes bacterium]|nr:IS1595 family transposase [Bacteroidota bacterium]
MDLRNIIKTLTQNEKAELALMLNQELKAPTTDLFLSLLNSDQKILCPHCKSNDIYGHGVYKGRKRYKCKDCKKTFNDFTGTAISGIKKTIEFNKYITLVVESVAIRKASSIIGVNMKTIFDWRHKLLSSMSSMNGLAFSGIVECDDKQLDINNKGDRNLNRKPYKRPSDRDTKRGVSNDKVSIMVATDRKGNPTMQIAKIGRIDTGSIEKTIGGLIGADNILCSDSHPSIIAWAKEKQLEHHTFIASRHVKDKCYHVQHVNSMDSFYERWIRRFNGVATKYLNQYLNWFIFLEKVKKSSTQTVDLVRNVISNVSTIKTYRSIKDKYNILLITQYSKT